MVQFPSPPTLAPQPMRLLRRSSISISQGLKKFQGLQNLTACLRHQDTLFFRLFWGKSLKIWYLQKMFSPSAYSRWCFFSFKIIIPLLSLSRVIVNCCKWQTLAMLNGYANRFYFSWWLKWIQLDHLRVGVGTCVDGMVLSLDNTLRLLSTSTMQFRIYTLLASSLSYPVDHF